MKAFDPALAMIAKEAGVRPPHVFHCLAALRELGARFNAAVYADFAKLELRHVESIMAALDAHNLLPKRAVRETVKGARLSPDWALPDDWKAFARGERYWLDREIDAEAELFADYWKAQPGQKGVKLDWFATWRNWCRNSRRPSGERIVVREGFDQRESQERTAALYDRMGRTTEAAEIRRGLSNVVPFKGVA